jgi:hypothetical protein
MEELAVIDNYVTMVRPPTAVGQLWVGGDEKM